MYDSDERQGLGKECKWVLLKRVKGKNSRIKKEKYSKGNRKETIIKF